MLLIKTALATVVALSLAACGSSGGGSSAPAKSNTPSTQTKVEQSVAEKAAKEKAEAQRLAAEKAAKEKAETERLATEKVAKEKAEAEAERLAAEKVAKEKAEANRLAKEKAFNDLVSTAKSEGLNDFNANVFAQNNVDKKSQEQNQDLEKMLILQEKSIVEGQYKDGLTRSALSDEKTNEYRTQTGILVNQKYKTGEVVYNQKYSIITSDLKAGNFTLDIVDQVFGINEISPLIMGLKTKQDALPKEGSATYVGKAFTAKKDGDLTYSVNFSSKTGSGKIDGVLDQSVVLEQGDIKNAAISSTIKRGEHIGEYSLNFFGKNAEEIAGEAFFKDPDDGAEFESDSIGFGGTRGEIQK